MEQKLIVNRVQLQNQVNAQFQATGKDQNQPRALGVVGQFSQNGSPFLAFFFLLSHSHDPSNLQNLQNLARGGANGADQNDPGHDGRGVEADVK